MASKPANAPTRLIPHREEGERGTMESTQSTLSIAAIKIAVRNSVSSRIESIAARRWNGNSDFVRFCIA